MQRNNKIKSKISNRGKKCIMVGYVRQSTGDTYRMFNLGTNKVTNTRGVKCTNKLYEKWFNGSKEQSDYYTASEEDTDEEINESEEEVSIKEQPRRSERLQTKNETDEKVIRALRKLNVSYNPIMSGMAFADDECAMVGGGIDDSYDNPDTFEEAWNHPHATDIEHWRTAIKKEFNNMIKRNVWRQTKTNKIPEDRRLIGSKWVFRKKRNGVFRARLVGLGYSQIPGVDHKDNFSPVVTDNTLWCVLVIALMKEWEMEVVDIETAFLYGVLDEAIFMKIPEGLDLYLESAFENDENLILESNLWIGLGLGLILVIQYVCCKLFF